VALFRVFNGPVRPFDEPAARAMQDPVCPLGHGEALAAAIPGAVLHVVPGMGHVMTSPGLPEEVADLIRL